MTKTEYDNPWKDIVEQFFKDFMQFFFPQIHKKIDWQQKYEFMEQELQKVVRESVTKNRRVDKLVKVWLQDGKQILLYIHIEIQSQYDSEFSKRMFIYHYRLYDRFGTQVTSLAILGDKKETWRPCSYHYEIMGCELSFRFPMIKLLDYKEKWSELEKSSNPFSMVVRIHLKTLTTKKTSQQRLDWKKTLFQALYEEHYAEKHTIGLLIFLDWVMTLADNLDKKFDDFVEHYEEAKKMQYVTTWERKGIEKGCQQGRQEGRQQGRQQGIIQTSRKSLLEVLDTRFQQIPQSLKQLIQSIDDVEILSKYLRKAILVESLEIFEQLLQNSVQKNT